MGGMLSLVQTFDGTKALKNNCKHIKGEYYEMNRQCFMMDNGKWNRVNNGKIGLDKETGRWEFISKEGLLYGIVAAIPNSSDYEFGYFSRNRLKNSELVTEEKIHPVWDAAILENNPNVVESPGDGRFYTQQYALRRPSVLRKRIVNYGLAMNYSASSYIREFTKAFNKEFKPQKTISGELAAYRELGKTRFGFEFETWNGTVPERYLKPAGLIPLRDGSLNHNGTRSYEYATIPFSGELGMLGLKNNCELLTRYTEISNMCSTHVHLSGFPATKDFVVAVYVLAKALESEIFSLFPAIFSDTTPLKGKNYCGALPNLRISGRDTSDLNFDRIYHWLVGNSSEYPFKGFNVSNHPNDPGDHSKWNIAARYVWLNFVPFIWGERGTLEFRIHPPTTNITRTINWLFITNAILRFAEGNSWRDIFAEKSTITLDTIFRFAYSKHIAEYLQAYIADLKKFRKQMDKIQDNTGISWCNNDPSYTFIFRGIKCLI